jgi:hypothetical protein
MKRDERRNDDGDAVPAERRNLVAERLARAGREQHHGVPPRDHVADDVLLLTAKPGVAEHLPKHRVGVLGIGLQSRSEVGHGFLWTTPFALRQALAQAVGARRAAFRAHRAHKSGTAQKIQFDIIGAPPKIVGI